MTRRNYNNWTEQNYIDAVKQLDASNQEDLRRKDSGLYLRMKNEGLLDTIVPEKESKITLEDFLKEVSLTGARNINELVRIDRSLYMKGRNRGWVERISFGSELNYSSLTFEEFNSRLKEINARTRQHLLYLDKKLYLKASNEGWISIVFPKKKSERYGNLSYEGFSQKINELGATSRKELYMFSQGLYCYVANRHPEWFDLVFTEVKNHKGKYSGWTFEDYKLAIEKTGARNGNDLKRKYRGLHEQAQKAGVIKTLFGTGPARDYSDWSRGEFVTAVKMLDAISSNDLKKKDRGLHEELFRRDLLEVIFSDYKKRKVTGHFRNYSGWTNEDYKREIEKIGAKTKSELAEKDHGLYKRLKNIGALNGVFSDQRTEKPVRKKRAWYKKSDDEVLEFYKANYSHITSGAELNKIDPGFYLILSRRELIDKIFPEGPSMESILESYVCEDGGEQ